MKRLMFIYIRIKKNHLLIAIPDVFWSFEISLATHINKINDELMMQLFTLIMNKMQVQLLLN